MLNAKLLAGKSPLQLQANLALAIGVNEAIVLQQVHYWLHGKNKRNDNKTERDGRLWVYNTYEEWQSNFPFWSLSTIKRIFISLESQGLVISEMYEKSRGYRRKWYTIDYNVLDLILQEVNMTLSLVENDATIGATTADDETMMSHSLDGAESTAGDNFQGYNPVDVRKRTSLSKSGDSDVKKPVSRRKRLRENLPDWVETIYQAYPRKQGKAKALEAIYKAVEEIKKGKIKPDEYDGDWPPPNAPQFLYDKVREFAEKCSEELTDMQYVPLPAAWFERGNFYCDQSPENDLYCR